MKKDINFAAFIMTYKRVSILETTIEKILNQTYPPQKIVIVDNDPEKSASVVISKFPDYSILYHSIGYNSGPAGAAKRGLELLSYEGYQWIAWMDDDDPPIFSNTFEILLAVARLNKNCGCVGNVGQWFNFNNGMMRRVPDEELFKEGILEVDNIAGNMCKIINADVCRINSIYPDDSLFFGFEELDFDLRMKKAGYTILVDRHFYKKHREHFNRMNLNLQKGLKKDSNRIWRDYYSLRNSLIILRKNHLYLATFLTLLRSLIKIFSGFRFGVNYGIKNTTIVLKALLHFVTLKKGKIDF